MSLIPTQISELLGTINPMVVEINETAGTVQSVYDMIRGKGEGLAPDPSGQVQQPAESVSPVSTAVPEAQQAFTMDKKTMILVGGGVGLAVLFLLFRR